MGCRKSKGGETTRAVYGSNPERAQAYPTNKISNTKYTILTFLPLNLYEQFSRFMNLYFLLIACLQLWNAITPVNPLTTWLPLVLIFLVSAIKEGLDDYYRYVADKEANNRPCQVARGGVLVEVRAADIVVGDVLYIVENEEVAADIVLLQTSADGASYIETANLDGETDLKSRTCLTVTQELSEAEILNFKGVCECAGPNPEIYKFDSNMRLVPDEGAEKHSLSVKHTALQGCMMRNTEWVYGLVVYTGNQSKISMNKRIPPTKWTHLDKLINKTTILIFILQLCFIIAFGIAGGVWREKNGKKMEYLLVSKEEWYDPIVIPLRFMLLMSFMIPISLKVTMDMVKFYYAQLINWDIHMYDETTNTPAEAKNTAISEDLGQIEYVFSDKTGTITENIMRFQKCAVDNVIYGHSAACSDATKDPGLHAAVENPDNIVASEFFRCLALNQTVVPNTELDANGKYTYKSSSPDEEALVLAAQDMGVAFTNRDGDLLTINYLGATEVYELMNVLEFSSDRKRMSVIVRDNATGRYKLYMKGADDKVISRLNPHLGHDLEALDHQLETFAQLGLRTLVIGYRYLEDADYLAWADRWHEANTSIVDRDTLLANVYEEMEQDLELLGVTAIEDKLQDEVPETIALLRRAGIKFWMLTGDKYSTALQIATACNLMSPEAEGGILLRVVGESAAEVGACLNTLDKQSRQAEARGCDITVIIEGGQLAICLESHMEQFRDIGMRSHAVVCCRVTPQQKALVVGMVKELDKVCLSIGDGGNDVTMIQEAHIGVGISGREGLQAARAADYAISAFRFLRRLVLIHGRYSYNRTAVIAQYAFFKSIYLCLIQVMYNFYAGFSGVSLFNTYALTTYNVAFTGLPLFAAALDHDLPHHVVFEFPAVYRGSQRSNKMNPVTMATWFLNAVFQAVSTLMITLAVFNVDHAHWGDGSPIDYASLGMVAYTSVVIVNQIVIFLYSHSLTAIHGVFLLGSIVTFFGLTLIYSSLPFLEFYTVFERLCADGAYWATIVLTVVVCSIPGVFANFVQANYFPTFVDNVRYVTRRRDKQLAAGLDPASTSPMLGGQL